MMNQWQRLMLIEPMNQLESTRLDSTVNFSGEQMAAYRERLSKRGKDGAKRGSG